MLQPRLLAPLRVLDRACASSTRVLSSPQHLRQPYRNFSFQRTTTTPTTTATTIPLRPKPTLSSPAVSSISLSQIQVRHASHATQGAANRHSRDPAGKRLGAKRANGEYVVPGCIIFRQRGTKWFPGENCAMGRDHTIYAAEAGYVRYYLDPERHPDRKYIGVCFEKEGRLPTPRNAPTRRKLNRVAIPLVLSPGTGSASAVVPQSDLVAHVTESGTMVASIGAVDAKSGPQLRPGYMYREANWQIGRAAEKAGITAKAHQRKNRWLAWRKRQARRDKAAQMKSLKSSKKSARKAKSGR